MSSEKEGLLNLTKILKSALVEQAAKDRDKICDKIELDLSTASTESEPYAFNAPFKSIHFESCIDTVTGLEVADGIVFFKANDSAKNQTPIRLTYNSAWKTEYMVSRAFFYWKAQPNRKIVLKAYFDSEFMPGAQVNINAGNVTVDGSVGDGKQLLNKDAFYCEQGTVCEVVPQDLTRKCATVENISAYATIHIGGSADLASGNGIPLEPGDVCEYRNTAALYALFKFGETEDLFETHLAVVLEK
jgi:hypothetical protein